MNLVVNATPLEVLVPPAVYTEVTTHGSIRPGSRQVAQATWLQIRAPASQPTIEPLLLGLDDGEMQVILLAREMQPIWVAIDERLGRRVARAMQIPLIGTLGLLLAAFHAELLTKQQTINTANQMVTEGIRISPALLQWLDNEINQ